MSFLPNKQFDRRTQLAANLTWLTGTHSFKGGAEYNRVFADQTFGFNQFGRFIFSGTDTAQQLDMLSVGGTIANRFDSNIVTYQRQLGNLRLEFPTQEIAFYAQDNWKVRPNLTINYGVRWEGAANPTPEANNDFMLNALSGVTFPNGGTTVDPTQIPDQWNQWGPRVGFAWDVANDGRTVVRGYTGIYYARSPALLYAAPMNNFRVPAGDLSLQLPLAGAVGQSEQHGLQAARAHRHRPQHLRAGQPADPYARAAAAGRRRAGHEREPVQRPQPLVDGQGLQEPARDAVRRRDRAGVHDGCQRRRRVRLREDRPPAAQRGLQPACADDPSDRPGAAALFRPPHQPTSRAR